jgi:hyperosmotically inducible periplasmic protein
MARILARFLRLGLWLSLATCSIAPLAAQQPDNTKVNKTAPHPNADQQKSGRTDTTITRDIRRSIVGDKTLSTYAHNIKIITKDGDVTLRGPVRSDDEKQTIEAKATQVAGAGHVKNDISVTPAKSGAKR